MIVNPEDDVRELRKALEAGPTPGPWVTDHANHNLVARDGDVYEYVCEVAPSEFSESEHDQAREQVDAAYIAAASPDRIRRILDRLEAAERANERQEDALNRLQEWARAYPLECFPEPDLKKAHQLLLAGGMTLDAISASNMRHVITQVAAIVDEAQKGTQ
jgi:lipopolysaccharide biosynthesis regulator YciM